MAYKGGAEAVDEKGRITYNRRSEKRSLRRLATELNLANSRPLELLSVKFDWQNRVEAYDIDLDRRARQAQEEAVIKMREDHALLGAQMIRKALPCLLKMPEEEISAGDLVRLAGVGVKIERLSRGESTENQSVSGKVEHEGAVKVSVETQANLKDLSEEELGQLEQRHRVRQRRPHSRETATGAGNKADIKQAQCKYCADNNLKLYQHQ